MIFGKFSSLYKKKQLVEEEAVTKPRWFDPSRLEVLIVILIALVSLSTALAAWRTNSIGSKAGDANRQGLIDAVKKQTAANEDWRKVYEEAGYAQDYAVYLAGIHALEASGDASAAVQADVLRKNLLNGLQELSTPLGTDAQYQNSDGTYDIQKRFTDLEAESPDLNNLDPEASFKMADQYYNQQRWLTMGTVLLAITLFWLVLAQIGGRARVLTLLIGVSVYLLGLLWFLVVEVIFWIGRGGLS
jgi:hypothetical protein